MSLPISKLAVITDRNIIVDKLFVSFKAKNKIAEYHSTLTRLIEDYLYSHVIL